MNITARDFLDTVFAEVEDREVVCVTKASPRGDDTLFWNIADDHDAFTRWRSEDDPEAWYFCVSTVDGTKNDKGTALRRRGVDFVRYHCLVLDDIGTKAEPPPVAPTWIMETSEGNFQYGYMLWPGDDRAQYEAVVDACHARGWGDAGAGGALRVMRLPGSANLKPGREGFRSWLTMWLPDAVWTLDDLTQALGLERDEIHRQAISVPASVGGVEAKANIDPMLDWLAAAGHVVADDGSDFVTIRCPWHERHTSGADTAGYSPLGRGTGEWVQRRGFKCLHEHCTGQSFRTFSEWAVGCGAPKVSGVDPLPWLQEKFTYIGYGKRVADLEQRILGGRWLWEFEDWGNMYKGRVMVPGRDQPIEMKTAFLESPDTIKAIDTQYWPVRADQDESTLLRNGQLLVNTYVPPNWPETGDMPDVFLDHIDYLLPCDTERDIFLNWMAYKVQNPARRSYGVLMVADEAYGVGRSWLRSMFSAMWQGKVNAVTLPQLIGRGTAAEATYNDWTVGCQLLIVDEAKEGVSQEDFYRGYETFKSMVDTRVGKVRVNPKYGRTRDDYMFWNCLIFSNHSDALALPTNDRRICVMSNPTTMETPAYYDALEASLDGDEPRRVYWYLMHRDVTGYDNIYPPMTSAKLAMTDQHRSPSDEIKEWISERYEGDLFTRSSLKSAVISAASALDYPQFITTPGGITRTLWGKMGPLRDEKNGARYVINGVQTEIRALRGREMWRNCDYAREAEKIIGGLAAVKTAGGVI